MSLFRSKEWWSANLNDTESYDSQCLLVSVIGKDRYQSILLGNHEGFFRVYGPTSGMTEDGVVIGYKPNDLLMEIQFPAPILQIGMGTLVSGCHEKNLAVLHPNLLSVYTLARKEGDTAIGDQMSLGTVYQHHLRHSAYSFVLGPFGGGRGRDFICVQSLDGLLSFYEQESFAFQMYLPDFLLPSPFVYLDKIDCFLFLNSSLILDCYSYENLASASQAEAETPKILKYWSHNISESILDMKVVTGDRYNIVILGERNLYNISDSGQIIFMKRLEYKPMAFYAFLTAETKKLIVLVATDNCLLNIYEDTSLKWSMLLDQVPVSVNRIVLSNLYGGIVLLSENGYLQCVYLGTHPSVYIMPPLLQPEIDVNDVEAELKRLQTEILEKDSGHTTDADLIGVSLFVDSKLADGEGRKVCKISLEISNQTPINKIQVMFVVDPPLSTTVKSCRVSCCDKTTVENEVFLENPGSVSNLVVKACVSYINANGTPFAIEREGKLPANLVLTKANPAKEAKYKITIATNKPVCPLNVIFKEFMDENSNPNVIGVKYANSEAAVTILTAKTTQRYRFQSDHLECMALVLSVAVERLKKYFHGSSDFSLSYDGALPLQTYFEEIEKYHGFLQERKSAREKLSKRTSQYRTIQKKVLVNLKEITPKPISGLNNILTETYEMILSSFADIEEIEKRLEFSRYRINSLCSLLITLMELMTISRDDMRYLRSVFSGNVYDTDDQGWLETQLAACMFFLRTSLAKSLKDQQKPTEITLDPVPNTSKLVKCFSSVIDRVTKGTYLVERSEYESEKELLTTIPGVREADEDSDVNLIPEGSKLANLEASRAESSGLNTESRKDKRLTKQERVDSLGVIGNSEDGTETSVSEQEQDVIQEGVHKVAEETEQGITDSGYSVEDDTIWDVKVEDTRI